MTTFVMLRQQKMQREEFSKSIALHNKNRLIPVGLVENKCLILYEMLMMLSIYVNLI